MRKPISVPDYGRTFPLYVPPIDWYFLTDDGPDYPMSFFLDLDFSGRLEREKFEEAYDEALARPSVTLLRRTAGEERPTLLGAGSGSCARD